MSGTARSMRTIGSTLLLLASLVPAGGGAQVLRDRATETAQAATQQPAGAVAIALPEALAVELPSGAMTRISPTESPLRELLELASTGGLRVSQDQTEPLPIGPTEVTWTAWEGSPGASPPRATRKAHVYVFPHGQMLVGLTRTDHATASNGSAKVVRDRMGGLHMVWLDARREGMGNRVMYRRAMQDPAAGGIVWVTPATRISDPGTEGPTSFPAIEVSENAVHFAWFGGRTTRYRRVIHRDGVWTPEPVRDTGARDNALDRGPDLAVRSDHEIHILTPTGQYAVSRNGGAAWSLDRLPRPPGARHAKNPALAVDRSGNAHVVFTGMVRNAASWSSSRPNAGYWELRYARRTPEGNWVDAHNILAAFPEWRDPGNAWDILADWPDIAVDAKGNLHVAWHGTATTHIYGNDEAYYIRRPATGPDAWGAWGPVQPLHSINRAAGESFSYAPSLAVDAEADLAIAVLFYQVAGTAAEIFDSTARVLRGGVLEGTPIPLSRMARTARDARRPQDAMSTWFPSAGPRLFRHANGRAWLDVLSAVETPPKHKAPYFVIYQAHEVTDLLRVGDRR